MRRVIILIIVICTLVLPVNASEFTAPTVPNDAKAYMPENAETFGDGLMSIIREALADLQPSIVEAAGVCLALIAISLLLSFAHSLPGADKKVVSLVGTLAVSTTLIGAANSLIQLGSETVQQISEYGRLLLPVMTAAVAAQGGATSSAALYTGTVVFDSVLASAISNFVVPMLYIFLCLCIASNVMPENALNKLRDFAKWLMTWSLKVILYVFTGYISITGVISGTADASAVKAAKLTISSVVPVVGGILSDASETVLVSAGIMKNTVGIYGFLAVIAIWIGPFLRIGVQYLLLKVTAAVCTVFSEKTTANLMQAFSGAMGMLLAMTGAACLLLLISIVCFMKGGI